MLEYVGDLGMARPDNQSGTLEGYLAAAKVAGNSTWGVTGHGLFLSGSLLRFADHPACFVHVSAWDTSALRALALFWASTFRGGPNAIDDYWWLPGGSDDLRAAHEDNASYLGEVSSDEKGGPTRQNLIDLALGRPKAKSRRPSPPSEGAPGQDPCRLMAISTGSVAVYPWSLPRSRQRMLVYEPCLISVHLPDEPGVFELHPNAGSKTAWKASSKCEEALIRLTGQNHGVAGTLYLEHIAHDLEATKTKINKGVDYFLKRAGVSRDDPGWRLARTFGLAYVANRLAIEAGIIPWTKELVLDCALSAYRAARAMVQTEGEQVRSLLADLKRLAGTKEAIDLDAKNRPSSNDIDGVKVFRRKREGHRQLLIASKTFEALGDEAVRKALLATLFKAGIYVRPGDYPRHKTWQVKIAKNPGRPYFYVFSRKLLKFELPDD